MWQIGVSGSKRNSMGKIFGKEKETIRWADGKMPAQSHLLICMIYPTLLDYVCNLAIKCVCVGGCFAFPYYLATLVACLLMFYPPHPCPCIIYREL